MHLEIKYVYLDLSILGLVNFSEFFLEKALAFLLFPISFSEVQTNQYLVSVWGTEAIADTVKE